MFIMVSSTIRPLEPIHTHLLVLETTAYVFTIPVPKGLHLPFVGITTVQGRRATRMGPRDGRGRKTSSANVDQSGTSLEDLAILKGVRVSFFGSFPFILGTLGSPYF